MKPHERLRESIRAAGISQKTVAAEAGMTESALSNILAGRRTPSMETAEAILRVLRERTGRKRGLTLNDLVGTGKAA
ncbi:MAG: helix-turn-helix transcriptional regulator [Thermoanaerobaculia bacterium]|jgi:transcriptional regulator with XRE-family HTH domain|nr:helix-turn-helix transcriptional regulator [Thermoanaerobaculia bacterium]